MSKTKTSYVCRECGGQSAKWAGQCSDCEAWNTLDEIVESAPTGRLAGLRTKKRAGNAIQTLDNVKTEPVSRMTTGLSEFDRVLGGGLVPGSVVLIGGDPGIGKSTVLLQALHFLNSATDVLYVTGEESAQQIALRAQRLGIGDTTIPLMAENALEPIVAGINAHQPKVVVIDSVQTLFTDSLQSAPGSVVQVRETAQALVRIAKDTDTTIILVGHVTKEGALAGPRILEHMVDAVLYFEGDRGSSFRLIRAVKNRFGAVNEIGVFAMTDRGLREVTNPSAMFVGQQQANAPGSVIMATLEGTRPLLVEVQALVDQSGVSQPRRLTVGLEQNRLSMLLAVLHQHAGLSLHDQDVFVNVVGGVRVTEPAADLALALAIVSSFRGRITGPKTLVFGEVGLTGEVRPVQRGQERLKEAAKLGFERALIPKANAPKKGARGTQSPMTIVAIERIEQALDEI